MDIFAIFCPDGALGYDDMKQCQREKWVPIATITKGEKITALLFLDPQIATRFIKRNYPKEWVRGVIALCTPELQWMQDQGWEIRTMTYPSVLKDTPGFGFEVLEFQTTPDLFMQRT